MRRVDEILVSMANKKFAQSALNSGAEVRLLESARQNFGTPDYFHLVGAADLARDASDKNHREGMRLLHSAAAWARVLEESNINQMRANGEIS